MTRKPTGKTKRREAVAKGAKLGKKGRIVIPAEVRKAAGLEIGDELAIVSVEDGEVRIRTRAKAWREVAKHYADLAREKPLTKRLEEMRERDRGR